VFVSTNVVFCQCFISLLAKVFKDNKYFLIILWWLTFALLKSEKNHELTPLSKKVSKVIKNHKSRLWAISPIFTFSKSAKLNW